ncbi:aminomethyl-transferring glycine dehydrogenase subunit GcvPA [Abyssibacter sp.]|jgi:glycine dehydrogenase subunit 1|uniref:aminomethyl-transferring glycine dehydrogenase subunit GcvPA n=1 Tax=Abyssibacter sp. TaxID=2320200 RepID=UPI0025C3F53F|nr:aminomethyl-transferring glycine dehydrogenase subunit GcvPA [Abyssibacter sp.]MCK5860353.1 aminomethyl-transferring glycine dehydrogenase subunit GcvPA [Abyssibacter sp.]
MPFIPHTESDVEQMLGAIDAPSIEALFDEIPAELRCGRLDRVPEGMTEMEITRLMHERADADGRPLNFIGAGAYEHHVPAAVWEIVSRGEFYSAYTPYQAEASQGTLQVIYEFQTMMCGLTGLDVSNASLYDGATALAEALLMAVRANRKSKSRRILMPRSVAPVYRQVVETICSTQGLQLVELAYDPATGTTPEAALAEHAGGDITAVVIPHPNFFGCFEAVDQLTDWAHANGALAVALVNPVALALTRAPGEWGAQGVDICCGEGQPLGSPLSSGGPYFGFMTCKQALVRQLPGRIVGRTLDLDGKPGFALTLQAREQHIRRGKATSNICTNQGLLVTAATIHMSILGPAGLQQVARASMANTRKLVDALVELPGVEPVFSGTRFHEAVLRFDQPVRPLIDALGGRGIVGGYALEPVYPELKHCLLVCATETKTDADIDTYVQTLAALMRPASAA